MLVLSFVNGELHVKLDRILHVSAVLESLGIGSKSTPNRGEETADEK